MNLKITTDKLIKITPFTTLLKKGGIYEVEDIIQDAYKIKVPMKQKGKFRYALVKDDEGELID